MKSVYRFKIWGRCPVDGSVDEYDVEVVVDGGFWPVEEILKKAKAITAKPIFQEPFTQLLAMDLQASVTTTGVHSGVHTTCTMTKPEGGWPDEEAASGDGIIQLEPFTLEPQ
jgi:hypothetical protein